MIAEEQCGAEPPVAGRREQGKEARRQALLAAAKASLAAGEFSMRRVAELAGVSDVTPYNLFGSKGGLLAALYRERVADSEARLPRAGSIDALSRFFLAIDGLRDSLADHSVFYRSFYAARIESRGGRSHHGAFDEGVDLWQRLLQATIDQGQVEAGASSALLARHFIQLLSGAMQEWIDGAVDADGWHAVVAHGVSLLAAPLASGPARAALDERRRKTADYLAGRAGD